MIILKKYKAITIGFISLLFFFRILLCFQGFDFTDEGWVLTFYKYIYTNPEVCTYQFVYYFAGIIGGTFELFFDKGGILYFRFLTVIVEFLILYLLYRLLKEDIPIYLILLSYTIILFSQEFGIIVLHHNLLSGLLLVLSASFLSNAVFENAKHYLIFSGIFFVLFGFSRLPNFLVVIFIGLFFVGYLFKTNNFNSRNVFKKSKELFWGYGFGLFIILLLLLILEHFDILKVSILEILDKGKADSSSSAHNFNKLIWDGFYAWKSIFKTVLVFITIQILIIRHVNYKRSKIVFILAFATIIWLFVYFIEPNLSAICGLFILGSINLFLVGSSPKILFLNVIALITLLINPLGSDGYFNMIPWSMYLIGPLSFYGYYLRFKEEENYLYAAVIGTAVILFFLLSFGYTTLYNGYFDKGHRLNKRFPITSSKSKYIWTTKSKSDLTNSLVVAINSHVPKDASVIAYNSLPMLHYLTNHKPAIPNSWVWVYDVSSLKRKLDKISDETKDIYIVVQKFQSIYHNDGSFEGLSDTLTDTWRNPLNKRKIFAEFVLSRNYKVIFEDDNCQILGVKIH